MGQRAQILIRTPEVHYNDNNPNNKPRTLYVLHNQWLYGHTFIRFAGALVGEIHKELNEIDKRKLGSFDDDSLHKVVRRANVLSDKTLDTYAYFTTGSYAPPAHRSIGNGDMQKLVTTYDTIDDLMSSLDNNNGYILIDINNNGVVTVNLFNGEEDAPIVKQRTPRQYLNLFYTNKEIVDMFLDCDEDADVNFSVQKELIRAFNTLHLQESASLLDEWEKWFKSVQKDIYREAAEKQTADGCMQ